MNNESKPIDSIKNNACGFDQDSAEHVIKDQYKAL